jgi:hypothetical protein
MVGGVAQRLLGSLPAPGGTFAVENKRRAGHGGADISIIAQPVGQMQFHTNVMLCAIQRNCGQRHQGDGHAEQIQILRKSRRSKTGLKPHAGKFTGKTGTGGCHL